MLAYRDALVSIPISAKGKREEKLKICVVCLE
jgi:hypothetical protein